MCTEKMLPLARALRLSTLAQKCEAYIGAFRKLHSHPHRLVAVDDMPYQEIMSQPLFHSWQVPLMGNPRSWEAWDRQGRVRLQHVRVLILSGDIQTQSAPLEEVSLILDSMPASWAEHVCAPSPQPTHLATAALADSRVFCLDADGQLIHTYTATFTEALVPALTLPQDALRPPLPADLRPVLVMDWDPTRPWHPRHMGAQAEVAPAYAAQAQPQPLLSLHIVGASSAGVLDPRPWGFGSEPAHGFVSGRELARFGASLQACQTLSVPCGQPSIQQRGIVGSSGSSLSSGPVPHPWGTSPFH